MAQPAVQELFWAIRKLLEQLAATRPVVVVFDDIHFAEPTFLQMLEYLADWAGRAPILVVCLARGELLDVRPDWATPRPNAELIPLLPLSDDETRQLVEGLVGGDRVDAAAEARISTVAEGNPLFVEQMLRMLADSGQLRSEAGQWVLDPLRRPLADPDHDPGTDVGAPGAPGTRAAGGAGASRGRGRGVRLERRGGAVRRRRSGGRDGGPPPGLDAQATDQATARRSG